MCASFESRLRNRSPGTSKFVGSGGSIGPRLSHFARVGPGSRRSEFNSESRVLGEGKTGTPKRNEGTFESIPLLPSYKVVYGSLLLLKDSEPKLVLTENSVIFVVNVEF